MEFNSIEEKYMFSDLVSIKKLSKKLSRKVIITYLPQRNYLEKLIGDLNV